MLCGYCMAKERPIETSTLHAWQPGKGTKTIQRAEQTNQGNKRRVLLRSPRSEALAAHQALRCLGPLHARPMMSPVMQWGRVSIRRVGCEQKGCARKQCAHRNANLPRAGHQRICCQPFLLDPRPQQQPHAGSCVCRTQTPRRVMCVLARTARRTETHRVIGPTPNSGAMASCSTPKARAHTWRTKQSAHDGGCVLLRWARCLFAHVTFHVTLARQSIVRGRHHGPDTTMAPSCCHRPAGVSRAET